MTTALNLNFDEVGEEKRFYFHPGMQIHKTRSNEKINISQPMGARFLKLKINTGVENNAVVDGVYFIRAYWLGEVLPIRNYIYFIKNIVSIATGTLETRKLQISDAKYSSKS